MYSGEIQENGGRGGGGGWIRDPKECERRWY